MTDEKTEPTADVGPSDLSDGLCLPWWQAKTYAQAKGWKVPPDGSYLDSEPWHSSWINYWNECAEHARNPDSGRPVAPHRSA